MTLAHYYGTIYLENVVLPTSMGGASSLQVVNYLGNGTEPAERLKMFASAIARLETDFGRWDIPWSEVNRYQRINGDIKQPFDDEAPSLPVGMAPGSWGALASFGAWEEQDTKRIYGTGGNSFVAVVEFGDKVRAKTMLAGGQSGDPASPHFADQAQRYVDREFKEAAFYREDVERRAERTYHPGR